MNLSTYNIIVTSKINAYLELNQAHVPIWNLYHIAKNHNITIYDAYLKHECAANIFLNNNLKVKITKKLRQIVYYKTPTHQ